MHKRSPQCAIVGSARKNMLLNPCCHAAPLDWHLSIRVTLDTGSRGSPPPLDWHPTPCSPLMGLHVGRVGVVTRVLLVRVRGQKLGVLSRHEGVTRDLILETWSF